jgi:hypothetical protein
MTGSSSFDLVAFEQLLDVYGADLARWPEELQLEVRELLASSADAQLAWSRAVQMEALLDAAPDLLPSAELSARIAALPARRPQGWAAWWPFGNPLAPLLAWGAAAAFGLFIGSGLVPGLESVADVASFSTGADPGLAAVVPEAVVRDSVVAGAAGSDSVGKDSAGSDAVSSDEAQAEDWSDLELALGLGTEWEDEP